MVRISVYFVRLRDFIKLEFLFGFFVKIGIVKEIIGVFVGSVYFRG